MTGPAAHDAGPGAGPRRPGLAGRLGQLVLMLVFLGYPALVWFGMLHWSPRVLALTLIAVLVPLTALRLRHKPREQLLGLAVVPAVSVAALGLAALLDQGGYVLMVPVVINVALLVGFGSTLRPGSQPMIERFARLQEEHLNAEQVAWCRLWTRLWCGFFVANGATALVLALAAPLSWWAAYTGVIAYVLSGLMLGIEWILRRQRFGPGGSRLSADVSGESSHEGC